MLPVEHRTRMYFFKNTWVIISPEGSWVRLGQDVGMITWLFHLENIRRKEVMWKNGFTVSGLQINGQDSKVEVCTYSTSLPWLRWPTLLVRQGLCCLYHWKPQMLANPSVLDKLEWMVTPRPDVISLPRWMGTGVPLPLSPSSCAFCGMQTACLDAKVPPHHD